MQLSCSFHPAETFASCIEFCVNIPSPSALCISVFFFILSTWQLVIRMSTFTWIGPTRVIMDFCLFVCLLMVTSPFTHTRTHTHTHAHSHTHTRTHSRTHARTHTHTHTHTHTQTHTECLSIRHIGPTKCNVIAVMTESETVPLIANNVYENTKTI